MDSNEKNDLIAKIEGALNSVRSYLQADGGDISFLELTDDYVVKVELLGNCKNCFLNFQTLKAGVESTIRKIIPQIKDVVAIEVGE